MKKIFLIVLAITVMMSEAAFAKSKSYLYVIKDTTPTRVINELGKKLGTSINVDTKNNVIYSLTDKYYFKTYLSEKKTELFLYSNVNKAEEICTILKNLEHKTYTLDDKSTMKKYNSDFALYSQEHNLNLVKAKKASNTAAQKYNPYSKPIKNRIVAKLLMNENGIEIQRIQYVPKYKVKKKANEYEYIITNNTGQDIIINKVASAEFIGLTQIAAYCVIPQVQDFIPLYGIIYGIQTDIEKNKFTRPHPIDETIKSGESMRILALSKTADNPVADFYFTVNSKKIIFTFNPSKGENL